MTIHNHQPVGNFGWVIQETYERAYLPMLDALERHPGVRIGLHYTGPLLDWLDREQPEFLARLAGLVVRDQVEIVGGGWYEPVLAALPERDRLAQLTRMADELERRFGSRPRGAWLAERVWEPDLPTALAGAGYGWTILDDAHFRAAAIPEEGLWGPYMTDDQGKSLTVWGTEQGLRYRIPFRPVDEVIAFLQEHATEEGDRVGTMGDDGEKFGAWPTTYEECWTNGWVDSFFSALEANADWLATTTPSAWLADHPPIGRVYVPAGSYAEMGEWALPPHESIAFARALHDAREEGRPEARWLRGAIWRNFQVRYREINDMHKQMLHASDLVEAMPAGGARERALDHLLAGQSNDPYWHGLFGGIYLPDLRVANLSRLIAAEDIALAGRRSESGVLRDVDLDGLPEVVLANDGEFVSVKLDDGAGIGRWDLRAVRFPLGAVLRRRPEAYHDLVRQIDAKASARVAAGVSDAHPDGHTGAGHDDGSAGAFSIHDNVSLKQRGLSDRLTYDSQERRSGLLRFLRSGAGPDAMADPAGADQGDFSGGAWQVTDLTPGRLVAIRHGRVRVDGVERRVSAEKTIAIGGDRLAPTLSVGVRETNVGSSPFEVRIALEWSTMLLGGGGNPAAWIEAGGERVPHDAPLAVAEVERYEAGNTDIGVSIDTSISPPADAWFGPIETVSNSEGGFELVYQGSTTLVSRVVTLRPGESETLEIAQTARVAADRAAEEAIAG